MLHGQASESLSQKGYTVYEGQILPFQYCNASILNPEKGYVQVNMTVISSVSEIIPYSDLPPLELLDTAFGFRTQKPRQQGETDFAYFNTPDPNPLYGRRYWCSSQKDSRGSLHESIDSCNAEVFFGGENQIDRLCDTPDIIHRFAQVDPERIPQLPGFKINSNDYVYTGHAKLHDARICATLYQGKFLTGFAFQNNQTGNWICSPARVDWENKRDPYGAGIYKERLTTWFGFVEQEKEYIQNGFDLLEEPAQFFLVASPRDAIVLLPEKCRFDDNIHWENSSQPLEAISVNLADKPLAQLKTIRVCKVYLATFPSQLHPGLATGLEYPEIDYHLPIEGTTQVWRPEQPAAGCYLINTATTGEQESKPILYQEAFERSSIDTDSVKWVKSGGVDLSGEAINLGCYTDAEGFAHSYTLCRIRHPDATEGSDIFAFGITREDACVPILTSFENGQITLKLLAPVNDFEIPAGDGYNSSAGPEANSLIYPVLVALVFAALTPLL